MRAAKLSLLFFAACASALAADPAQIARSATEAAELVRLKAEVAASVKELAQGRPVIPVVVGRSVPFLEDLPGAVLLPLSDFRHAPPLNHDVPPPEFLADYYAENEALALRYRSLAPGAFRGMMPLARVEQAKLYEHFDAVFDAVKEKLPGAVIVVVDYTTGGESLKSTERHLRDYFQKRKIATAQVTSVALRESRMDLLLQKKFGVSLDQARKMAAENKSAEVGDDAFGKVLSLAKYPTVETRIREREYKAFSSVKSWNVWTDTPGVCREIVGKFGDGKD